MCAAALERGLGAIVLVPEIALAPQTVGRVRARFGDRVAILHSALSEAERRDERERIADGSAPIVVGRDTNFMPRDDYYQMLGDADIVLCLYDAKIYRARSATLPWSSTTI